jgi:hypothetical protein
VGPLITGGDEKIKKSTWGICGMFQGKKRIVWKNGMVE